MGIQNKAPVHQPRNIPADRPLSSQRINVMFEEILRDLAEIFNTELPGVATLKTATDLANNNRFQGVETADILARGGTEGLEQGDHTKNWRLI